MNAFVEQAGFVRVALLRYSKQARGYKQWVQAFRDTTCYKSVPELPTESR